jgi:hypothetical protein
VALLPVSKRTVCVHIPKAATGNMRENVSYVASPLDAAGLSPQGGKGVNVRPDYSGGTSVPQNQFDLKHQGHCIQSAHFFIAKANPTPASKLALVT